MSSGEQHQRTVWQKLIGIAAISLIAVALSFVEIIPNLFPSFATGQAKRTLSAAPKAINNSSYYYVSKQGNNQDGSSWQNAWREMDQIDWSIVGPGDTIIIDGGTNGMTYSTPLSIGSSGSSGSPIRIRAATEAGRDGKITIFGGRYAQLPFCYQHSYQDSSDPHWFGIRTNDHSWIELDGNRWSGITIHGFERSGIRVDRNSRNVTIRNVEIYNNGYSKRTSSGPISEGVGLRLGGENVLLERAIIRDNGQDAIQSLWGDNNLRNFRMNESWLYNSRRHPSQNDAFNYCTHTDGIQIYDGGVVVGITVENSVIGPGFTQGLLLGQTRTSNGAWADVRNVVIRNTVVAKSTDNAIYGYRNSNSHNWHLDRVTLDCEITKGHCIYLNNRDHTVSDSVIYKGRVAFEDGLNHYYRNCVWENLGLILGKNANPQFASYSASNRLSQDDYTIANSSGCVGSGSQVTSGAALIDQQQASPTPAPTATPTSTPVATYAPASTATPTATATPTDPADPPLRGSGSQSCGMLAQEAENGELSGNFAIGHDSAASNGQFVFVTDRSGNRGTHLDEAQKISFCFNVSTAGKYRIKGWVYAESHYDNSFYIRINGQPQQGYIWHTRTNVGYFQEYVTADNGYEQLKLNLAPGQHTVEIFLREDGTRLDRLALEPIPEAASANSQTSADLERFAGYEQTQWFSGTIYPVEEGRIVTGEPAKGTLLAGMKSGTEWFTLAGVTSNGEPARFELQIDANGDYYIDAILAGQYWLELPLGYIFSEDEAPYIEISNGDVLEHRFEFTYNRMQTYLPLMR